MTETSARKLVEQRNRLMARGYPADDLSDERVQALVDLRESYDWGCAFDAALVRGYTYRKDGADLGGIDAVVRIVAADEGVNDEMDWIGVFEMADGRYLVVRAGCDYTGWDCEASGSHEWYATEAEALSPNTLTVEERTRLGLPAKETT